MIVLAVIGVIVLTLTVTGALVAIAAWMFRSAHRYRTHTDDTEE